MAYTIQEYPTQLGIPAIFCIVPRERRVLSSAEKSGGACLVRAWGIMPTLSVLVPQLSHDFVLLVALNLKVIFKVNLFNIS